MNKIITPKGYRRLKSGEKRKKGDMIWLCGCGPWHVIWKAIYRTTYLTTGGHNDCPMCRKK